MESTFRYEMFMSRIGETIRDDIKNTSKTKISVVYDRVTSRPCILRICKNCDLSNVFQALKETKHKSLTVVYDYAVKNGDTYVLEEYIIGRTLQEVVDKEGVLSEKQVAKIVIDICDGLKHLHSKKPPIIHNDIKPSNIMVRDDGSVKLFDFDISRTYKEEKNQNTRLLVTEEYASPEHFGFGQTEPRSDIYSLGVTMHKMLTGKTLSNEHKITYTGSFKKIIKKCVEKNDKHRYASVSALKRDLEKYINRKKRFLYKSAVAVSLIALFIILSSFDSQEAYQNDNSSTASTTVSKTSSDTATDNANSEIIIDSTIPESNLSSAASGDTLIEKKVENKYLLSGKLQSMAALNDGTFVYLEEVSNEYHLKSSTGEDYLLDELKENHSCELIYNNYSNKLYLLQYELRTYQTKVYALNETFNLELVTTFPIDRDRIGNAWDDAYGAFFSDGNLYCDVFETQIVNSINWSKITTLDFPVFAIINDTMFNLAWNSETSKDVIQEVDFQNKVINEYEIPISILAGLGQKVMYNNNEYIYIVGSDGDKDCIYKFDGTNFEKLVCLNDYKYYTEFSYDGWCVTDNTVLMYDSQSNVIKEFKFN